MGCLGGEPGLILDGANLAHVPMTLSMPESRISSGPTPRAGQALINLAVRERRPVEPRTIPLHTPYTGPAQARHGGTWLRPTPYPVPKTPHTFLARRAGLLVVVGASYCTEGLSSADSSVEEAPPFRLARQAGSRQARQGATLASWPARPGKPGTTV